MNPGTIVFVKNTDDYRGGQHGEVSGETYNSDGKRIRRNQIAVRFENGQGVWGCPPKKVIEVDIESSYAAVADELNDGSPGQLTLADLDVDIVYEAQWFARREGLPWPPHTGDYDRYLERKAYQCR